MMLSEQPDEQLPMNDAPKQNRTAGILKRWLPLFAIAGFMIFAFSMGWHKALSISALIENRERLAAFVTENFALTLLGYTALYVVIVVLSLPGAGILSISGGFLFGWLVSGSVTIFAATAGATLLFMAVTTSFGAALREKAGPWIVRLKAGFEQDAFNYLLFLRLVPAFPFWLVNLAPAMLGIKLSTYVSATLIGIIPGSFAFAFIGAGLDSVIEAQQAANADCIDNSACAIEISTKDLVTPEILAALAALSVLALIPVVLKRLRSRRTA
uniref:TVP38/TMEM64 family protein n=1 Tax=Pararhizobium sp. IMCC3301 TaxID=3067904 RepID=UPI0027412BA7|nr:VTT domain-containing protein [Pararhizobium sp. IMCC3301]